MKARATEKTQKSHRRRPGMVCDVAREDEAKLRDAHLENESEENARYAFGKDTRRKCSSRGEGGWKRKKAKV